MKYNYYPSSAINTWLKGIQHLLSLLVLSVKLPFFLCSHVWCCLCRVPFGVQWANCSSQSMWLYWCTIQHHLLHCSEQLFVRPAAADVDNQFAGSTLCHLSGLCSSEYVRVCRHILSLPDWTQCLFTSRQVFACTICLYPSFYPGCVNCNEQEHLYVCPVNLQLWSCWSLFLSFAWTRSTAGNWLSFSKNWCNIYYLLIPLVGFVSVCTSLLALCRSWSRRTRYMAVTPCLWIVEFKFANSPCIEKVVPL